MTTVLAEPVRVTDAAPAHRDNSRLFGGLGAAAVLTRVVFWVFTQRTWEDAYITLTPIRTLFAGGGLTHHSSEPHIHSFTSALSMLVPLVGNLVGQPLLALRLVALGTAGITMWLARDLAAAFKLSRAAAFVFGGYLAFDQLQVFFGISGMETQMAVAVALGIALAVKRRNAHWIGITCGVGLLARPDFAVFVVAIVALHVIRREFRTGARIAAGAGAIAAPWFLFATLYFGSPVAHTITAKNLYPATGFSYHPAVSELARYFVNQWKVLAPFFQYDLLDHAPVPMVVAELFAIGLVMLAAVGAWKRRTDRLVIVACGVVGIFFAYRTRALLNTYFMWYLPPFVALVVMMAAAGFEDVRARLRLAPRATWAIAIAIVAAYAAPTLLSMPIERSVQRDIEVGVREQVGRYLHAHMAQDDTVVLEPVGYIGYFAGDVTTIDYPGLTSNIATDAMASIPQDRRSVSSLVVATRPNWAVLRPAEWEALAASAPATAAEYELAERFAVRPGVPLSFLGMSYRSLDRVFLVFHRR